MPVFDRQGVTVLANQDPGTDPSLPPAGLLSYAAINTSTALADTDGQDCKVITGKRDQKITADMRERILGNLDSTITLNETHTVLGDKTEKVTGLYTLIVITGWNEEQHGPVNRHYFMTVTESFDNDHQQHTPDSTDWNRTKYSNTFVTEEQIGIVGVFQLALVIGICVTAEAILDLEAKFIHCELHGIHFANNVMEGKIVNAEAISLKSLAHYIGAALDAWVAANAGIDWDSLRPLA